MGVKILSDWGQPRLVEPAIIGRIVVYIAQESDVRALWDGLGCTCSLHFSSFFWFNQTYIKDPKR